MNPDRTRRTWMLVEGACWIAGCTFLATYFAARLVAVNAGNAALATFESMHEQREDIVPAALSFEPPNTHSWSMQRVAAHAALTAAPPVAVLRIDAVDLEVPVYEGVTEWNLNAGAAWLEATAPLGTHGNSGIAAHRDGYFRALRGTARGDLVVLQTERERLRYRVVSTSIVDPTAVEVLDRGNSAALTLVTCYPFYFVGPAPQRFIVRAELVARSQ